MRDRLVRKESKNEGPFYRHETESRIADLDQQTGPAKAEVELVDYPPLKFPSEALLDTPYVRRNEGGRAALREREEAAESRGIGRLGYALLMGMIGLGAYLILSRVGYTPASEAVAAVVGGLLAIVAAARRLRNIGGASSWAWAMLVPPIGFLIPVFCLVAPENYAKSGKLDAPAVGLLAVVGVGLVALAVQYLQ